MPRRIDLELDLDPGLAANHLACTLIQAYLDGGRGRLAVALAIVLKLDRLGRSEAAVTALLPLLPAGETGGEVPHDGSP